MKHRVFIVVFLISIAGFGTTTELSKEADKYWPQWRGPHATGVSHHASPPIEWSENKNIRWKVEIPGRGSSTPVLWGTLLVFPHLSAWPEAKTSSM